MLFAHKEIQVPSCKFMQDGKTHSVSLKYVKELESIYDHQSFEWFHEYLFDEVLKTPSWLDPISPTSTSTSTSNTRGCPPFHLFPRFLKKQQQQTDKNEEFDFSSMLAPNIFKKYIKKQKTSLFSIIKSISKKYSESSTSERHIEVKRDVIGQIVYSEQHRNSYRIDNIDFDSSPLTKVRTHSNEKKTIADIVERSLRKSVHSKQPLLVHRQMVAKVQKLAHTYVQIPELGDHTYPLSTSQEQPFIYLIPELCFTTGIRTDITQFGILLPTITTHIRRCCSLAILENQIGIEFHRKDLLQKVFFYYLYSIKRRNIHPKTPPFIFS